MDRKIFLRILFLLVAVTCADTAMGSYPFVRVIDDSIRWDSRKPADLRRPYEYNDDQKKAEFLSKLNQDYVVFTDIREMNVSDAPEDVIKDSIMSHTAKFKEIEDYFNRSLEIQKYLGKQAKDEWQRAMMIEILKKYADGNIQEKDMAKVVEDLEKGKLSKKAAPAYERFLRAADRMYTIAKAKYKFRIGSSHSEYGRMNVAFFDTVPNPFYASRLLRNNPEYYFDVHNKPRIYEGWEWVKRENGKFIEERYPQYIEYFKFADHPGLRWTGDMVYDDQGKLVRVPDAPTSSLRKDPQTELGKQLYQLAYEANKYNIQSASEPVKKYITGTLGMRELTAAEKKRLQESQGILQEALKSELSGNEQRQRRAAQGVLKAMFNPVIEHNAEGARWMSQIQKDYGDISDSKRVHMERTDDTNFRCIWYDSDLNPICVITYSYGQGDEPYSYCCTIKVEKP